MGSKGTPGPSAAAVAAEALLADLRGMPGLRTKAMFGGVGVFQESTMFAIVDRAGQCYLRADDETASEFERAGAERHGRMPYWQLPDEVRRDDARLRAWAERAVVVGRA